MPSITSFAVAAGLVGLVQSACTEIGGNYYCNAVTAVTYDDFGGSGTYNRVTLMNDTTGACSFTSYSYSGTNAPFDEELSLHIRGPIQLKQFAYYTPSTSSSRVKRQEHAHVHQHKDVHARDFQAPNIFAKAAASPTSAAGSTATTVSCPSSNQTTYTVNGESFIIECGFDRAGNINMVYTSNFASCIQGCAAYSGCVDVSYVSDGGGACYYKGSVLTPSYNSGVWGARLVSSSSSSSTSSTTKSTSVATSSTVKVSTSSTLSTSTATTLSSSTVKSSSTSIAPTSTTIQTSSSISTSASATATGNAWTQQSYYSSTAGTANNVVFLNNMGGGTVSGVWSTNFGSSLSYASSDGTAAASSAQVLADTTVTGEVILFQGTKCGSENTDCGYYRPGTVAYHGFGGARKILLLEFAMPTGTSSNVPAIWLLNALIPRTQQYGSCTCWGNTNGCGELDIFEVLTSDAANYMTSSIHGNQAGGDSDYFTRPTSATMKAAIVLDNGVLQISVLPSTFTFSSSLSASDYATIRGLSGLTDSVVTLA